MKKWPILMPVLAVGFYVALSLLIPIGIGFWFDKRASHGFPLFTLIGLGVGIVIMVFGVWHMVQPFLQEAKKEGKEEQIHRPIRVFLNLLPLRQKRDKKSSPK